MKGFIEFVRKQGIIGLAVGFILGGTISKLVSTFVNDIINPLVGIVLGAAKGLETFTLMVGPAELKIGHFMVELIDFVIIALVVYTSIHILKLDRIDKKEEKK